MTRGAYLVLEGPDGCGKSLQAELLAAWLSAEGREVLHLREPGSTPFGEALRSLLLDRSTGNLRPLSEAALFTAARAEMVRRQVEPALAEGRVVVVERCYLSTLVYQGLAPREDGVPLDFLRRATELAHGVTFPDRIFVLDVDYETGTRRRRGGRCDRIEAREAAFHRRVREGFLQLARVEPRAEIIDATGTVEVVEASLRSRVRELVGS